MQGATSARGVNSTDQRSGPAQDHDEYPETGDLPAERGVRDLAPVHLGWLTGGGLKAAGGDRHSPAPPRLDERPHQRRAAGVALRADFAHQHGAVLNPLAQALQDILRVGIPLRRARRSWRRPGDFRGAQSPSGPCCGRCPTGER